MEPNCAGRNIVSTFSSQYSLTLQTSHFKIYSCNKNVWTVCGATIDRGPRSVWP